MSQPKPAKRSPPRPAAPSDNPPAVGKIIPNEGRIDPRMLAAERRIVWEEGFNPSAFPYVREMIIESGTKPFAGRPPWSAFGRPGLIDESRPETLEGLTPLMSSRIVGWSEIDPAPIARDPDTMNRPQFQRRLFYLCPNDERDQDPVFRHYVFPVGPSDAGPVPDKAVDVTTIAPGRLGSRTMK